MVLGLDMRFLGGKWQKKIEVGDKGKRISCFAPHLQGAFRLNLGSVLGEYGSRFARMPTSQNRDMGTRFCGWDFNVFRG